MNGKVIFKLNYLGLVQSWLMSNETKFSYCGFTKNESKKGVHLNM